MAQIILTLGFLFLFVTVGNNYVSAYSTSVTTRYGKIIGQTVSVAFQANEYKVDKYLGIPYAKPPTKDRRFKKPEPYGRYPEPFYATEEKSICPQTENPFVFLSEGEQSEDCLFLDVYVPRQTPDQNSGHAVMFFIHGGAFTEGSKNMYRSEVLSSYGNVIVVTINYRLGLLGFMDIDDPRSPGNFGLWDQRLALQWVNENIGAFGGDKNRVTIFGESAGSMSVALQMLYPPNKGLFSSAITQSGALAMPMLLHENNIESVKTFVNSTDCNVGNMDEILACVQSLASEEIIKVISDVLSGGDMEAAEKLQFWASVDGEFIKKHPTDLFKKAETEAQAEVDFFRSIKLINGVNGAEGASFLLLIAQSENLDEIEVTREEMNSQYVPGTASFFYRSNKPISDAAKQLLIAEYTDWKNPDDPKLLREQFARLSGDTSFNVPAIEMSHLHSNGSDVDSYVYNFVPPLNNHLCPTPKWVESANHGDDLLPLFGYNFDFEVLLGNSTITPTPEWELNLSKRLMTYWSNFAKSGDPNKPNSEMISSTIWPKYNISSQQYLRIDREDLIGQFLYARELHFWRKILPVVMEATEHAQSSASHIGKKDEDTCDRNGDCG